MMIGLLNEKPLHASLKEWLAGPDDQVEVPVEGYVIDLIQNGQLLEIQTGNFASIKTKLKSLIQKYPVRLIYPIPREKWIIKLEKETGSGSTRRKAPGKGRAEDLFREMVSFPQLLAEPNFSLEVLFISEEEVRRFDENRAWRRRGWVIEERRLLEVMDRQVFETPADWRALLPEEFSEFTARELAAELKIHLRLAQKMAYCLRKVGVIERIGNKSRAYLYQVTEP